MIIPASDEAIAKAVSIIKAGGLVAFPTETVYGLAANALDVEAVKKIFAAKERPTKNPLIIHIGDMESISSLSPALSIPEIRSRVLKLAEFWPGPLSLVLPRSEAVPDEVTGGNDSVAIRIPDHPLALKFLNQCELPLAAPSANRFTRVSPTCAAHVEESLGNSVDLIIDGGPCNIGIESTVLSLLDGKPKILRHGAITKEDLTEVLQEQVFEISDSDGEDDVISPGMHPVHYAPKTQVILKNDFSADNVSGRVGLINFKAYEDELGYDFAAVSCLSSSGDLYEVARKLFSAMREMDQLDLSIIVIDTCENRGIGRAIMDRIKRASRQNRAQ